MWQTMAPLYEYRIFLPTLPSGLVERIDRSGGEVTTSEETYIVSRAPDGYNVKIRAGGLEVKAMIERLNGLERWQPLERLEFPIGRDRLNRDVLSRLDVIGPAMLDQDYSEAEFLYQVVVPSDQVDQCKVAKRRWKTPVDGCDAEIAQIGIADFWHCETFALEGKNAEAVLDAATRLKITEHPNQSYPAFIRHLTGMTPQAA